jgi:hypothetical protein
MLPLLRHLSTHSNSSHSIPFLPHDSSHDLYTHLLTLPTLRSSSSSSSFSLTASSLQTLLEISDANALGLLDEEKNKKNRTDSTNSELLYFHLESLLSSLLYRTTTVISYCSSTCLQYLDTDKELGDEAMAQASTSSDSILHHGHSLGYVTSLSKIAQTLFPMFPLCWHLLSVLAHTTDYLSETDNGTQTLTQTQSSLRSFYSELESNLWILKDFESSLERLVERDLYETSERGRKRTKGLDTDESEAVDTDEGDFVNQIKDFEKQIQRIEEVVTRVLCSNGATFSNFAHTSENIEGVWQKIFSGKFFFSQEVSEEPLIVVVVVIVLVFRRQRQWS